MRVLSLYQLAAGGNVARLFAVKKNVDSFRQVTTVSKRQSQVVLYRTRFLGHTFTLRGMA